MPENALFDDWPERYERWFTTPIGMLVRAFEGELVNELLNPAPGEDILDAGCGTGVFTSDLLAAGVFVTGLDVSAPMLQYARTRMATDGFFPVLGDMRHLPLRDASFDKGVSVTALEFITDGQRAVDELFRVVRPGGAIVVATLNSLSPWAARRRAKTLNGDAHVLKDACYRSPRDLLSLSEYPGTIRTAIHFAKDADPEEARRTEEQGRRQGLETGAFVAAVWHKPPF